MDQVHVIRHKVLGLEKVPARKVAREMGVSCNTACSRYVEGASQVSERGVAAGDRFYDARGSGRMEQLPYARSSAWTGGKQRHGRPCGSTSLLRGARILRWEPRWSETTCGRKRRRQEVSSCRWSTGRETSGRSTSSEVLVDVAGKRQKARSVSAAADVLRPGLRLALPAAGSGLLFSEATCPGLRPTWAGCPTGCCTTIHAPAVAANRGQPVVLLAVRGARGHYLFWSCFARPATGHDKGGVGVSWPRSAALGAGVDPGRPLDLG